jgi:hypothetical protein
MGRPKAKHFLAALLLLLVFTSSAWAEVCKGSKVTRADLAQYDA